jgi:hypothetical protein
VDLPPMPHEAQPNALPHPDYFAEALKRTRLQPPPRNLEHQLREAADGPRRRVVVLPVQTQAFGVAPALRAVVGAQLDLALANRKIDASRQTDIADAYGPFVRRLPDTAVDAFAKQVAPAGLLTLHLGHDGIDTAFVTLSLRDGTTGNVRRAHRKVALPVSVGLAVEAIPPVLSGLLTELGLGTEPPRTTGRAGCNAAAWSLHDVNGSASPETRACHAIIIGALLPRLWPPFNFHDANTDTPAKLAWVAEAWVQARAMEPGATARAIEVLAWEELRLEKDMPRAVTLLDVNDPVIAPLVKLLTAQRRAAAMPHRSTRESVQRLLGEAAQGLPPFVAALFFERGRWSDHFERVDLCAIERELPSMMPRAECRRDGSASAGTPGRANAAQIALHQHWRLASYYKDIQYFGKTQGQQESLARHLAGLPADIAAHPFVKQRRAVIESNQPSMGSAQDHLSRQRAVVQAFVQSTADLQRYDMTLGAHSLSEHHWTSDTSLLSDPQIDQFIDDEARLLHVLRYDRFSSQDALALRRAPGLPAAFLAAGSARQLAMHGVARAPVAAATPAATPTAPPPQPRTLFAPAGVNTVPWLRTWAQSADQMRTRIAAKPTDMQARVALAMQMLKDGQSVTQARTVIDAYPPNSRVEEQVTLSHHWARPAHAFFLAGELDTARHYYQRVRQIGTGSGSDLHARVRLRMIEGDTAGALESAEARLRRYEGDTARRDVAAFSFLSGQPARGWAVLLPRLASASTVELWNGAFVGHRAERLGVQGVKEWLAGQGLTRARMRALAAAPMLLHMHAVIDRLPTEEDVRLFQGQPGVVNEFRNDQWSASAALMRMALRKDATRAAFDPMRHSLALSSSESNKFLQPLFVWVAWQATNNQDPELDAARKAELSANDFDLLLAKAALLARDGNATQSLQFLRAARWQLWSLAEPEEGDAETRSLPLPYRYALMAWLMWRDTGQEAYRAELLRFVRAQQRVTPASAWLYSLQALADNDTEARAAAICRARILTPTRTSSA